VSESSPALTPRFSQLVGDITSIGLRWHAHAIVENSRLNRPSIGKTIRELARPEGHKGRSAIVISAGPSLYKNDILTRIKACGYPGTIIAIDGSLVRCLKAGITPDYVLTLDPHPTRMVRWFGDPDFEKNLEGDDYFSRQDLDVEFRNNSIRANQQNIEIVNQHGKGMKLIICSAAPRNVVERIEAVGFDAYWWAPLVDDPMQPGSLTRTIVKDTGLPAMNTGGTVGTAAWVFALTVLKIPMIAAVGMDLGYYKGDTSHQQTQTYHTLKNTVGEANLPDCFVEFDYPGTKERFYTDPTYYWYRGNLLSLLSASKTTLYNCTGGGTLVGSGVECLEIEDFCARVRTS
jgi:hypothetical protein